MSSTLNPSVDAGDDETSYCWILPDDHNRNRGEFHIAREPEPERYATACVQDAFSSEPRQFDSDDLLEVLPLGERDLRYDVCPFCRAALMKENEYPTFRAVPPE